MLKISDDMVDFEILLAAVKNCAEDGGDCGAMAKQALKILSRRSVTADEDGNKFWRNANGKLHRLDGPAVEWADGSKQWWVDGKLHRLDGPAVEWASGTKQWWVDGKRHRLDGPAFESVDGDKEWYADDKLHRTDGPAIEWAYGIKAWYIDGEKLTEDEFNKRVQK